MQLANNQPEAVGAAPAAFDAAYYAAEFGIGEAAGKRVLEIGFGNGSALGWLKDRGAEVYGLETNPILAERAVKLLGAVTGMLSRIRELLAPGGHALFRFPNGDSPFGRINQNDDPTHITILGGARISWFARRAGLEVQSLRAPAPPIGGVGLVRGLRRLLIRNARRVIEPAVGQLYFYGRRIPLDPNYLAVLRRLPAAAGSAALH